jgi:deoxycytidine triphosphate deaminase
MLIKSEIKSQSLVVGAQSTGERDSTYDATVGEIVERGKIISEPTFTLQPRHIVWIVSKESFRLPDSVTGLATLRTTWTHSGVLALNIGVVDPGWQGPLAAAIVNFSNEDFHITKGDTFLRLLFLEHKGTSAPSKMRTAPDYLRDIVDRSKHFSTTFLNMGALVDEVAKEIFTLPKLVVGLTILGTLLTFLSIFVPIAWTVWGGYVNSNAQVAGLTADVSNLKEKIKVLEDEQKPKPAVADVVQGRAKSSVLHAASSGKK